jgi:hypothetical protein
MKQVSSALAAGAAVLALGFIGCGGNGRAPFNLKLAADTDSTIRITWSVPTAGTPDAYAVYFRSLDETTFSLVAETTVNVYVHDPHGLTGWYRIDARFGTEAYDASTTPSTIPVRTDTVAVAELNAAGNSGYGWDRETGVARTYSMRNVGSRDQVDFYITDFKPAASNQLPYSIASPDMGPGDLGGVVHADSWRVNAFTDPLPDETGPLPAYAPNRYFNYVDINRVPIFIGCHTADDYYAFIRVTGVDIDNSWALVETWFQTVKGLRLTGH